MAQRGAEPGRRVFKKTIAHSAVTTPRMEGLQFLTVFLIELFISIEFMTEFLNLSYVLLDAESKTLGLLREHCSRASLRRAASASNNNVMNVA